MTLGDYWEILRRSWLLVVLTTALGAAAALGFSRLTTPVYQAQAQLFVSVQAADEYNALSSGYYLIERMKSYVGIVDTPKVLDPVIKELDPDGSGDVSGVSAANPTNTVLLNVSASDTEPTRAAAYANATAASLAREIMRLETTIKGDKPVKAEVIRTAKVPSVPISPRTTLNLALGALLGLMTGVGIAILRYMLDTTIKTAADLETASEAVSLGVVSYDPDAANKPLVTLRGSPRAEAYVTIRTNLRYVDVDHPPRTVVITSSVPGEGKTTTACNLAIAVAQAGSRVLLIEGDLRRPKVAEYLGVDGSIGLTDVLIGQIPFDEAVIHWRRGLECDFLASGAIPPNPSELLGSHQMAELLQELAGRYDSVIIDAPPLLPVSDAAILAAVTDGALLVVRHGETRQEQVQHATQALRQVDARILGTILNFAPSRRGREEGYDSGYGYGPADAAGSGRRLLSPEEVPAPEPRS